jgi:hypothetical protein
MLRNKYRNGAYRAIKDPDGVVSLWAIESSHQAPFSITFVDKGRVYRRVEDAPPDFLKLSLQYLSK